MQELTIREQQVLELIRQGKLRQQIAKQLAICERSVDAHRQNIQEKLGRHTVADLLKIQLPLG